MPGGAATDDERLVVELELLAAELSKHYSQVSARRAALIRKAAVRLRNLAPAAGDPTTVQIKVLFLGGEAWQDRLVVRWTDHGHPVVKEGDGEFIPTPGEWRPC